jgi:Xaa-Pro aminopeptidase
MIARPAELARFQRAAQQAGAGYVHCMLFDRLGAAIERFSQREISGELDAQVRDVVAADGGDDELARLHERLTTLARESEDTRVINTHDQGIDETYRCLLRVLEG